MRVHQRAVPTARPLRRDERAPALLPPHPGQRRQQLQLRVAVAVVEEVVAGEQRPIRIVDDRCRRERDHREEEPVHRERYTLVSPFGRLPAGQYRPG